MSRAVSQITVKKMLAFGAASCLTFLIVVWTAHKIHRDGLLVDDKKFALEIHEISIRHGVDPQLVRAVVFQESRFSPHAIGKNGEVGLMQVLRRGAVADWAKHHRQRIPSSSDLMDVKLNLEIGVWYLAAALERWKSYKHGVELALIQYNAGESRAERWKPVKPDGEVVSRIRISSTRNYVENIMNRYRKYTGGK